MMLARLSADIDRLTFSSERVAPIPSILISECPFSPNDSARERFLLLVMIRSACESSRIYSFLAYGKEGSRGTYTLPAFSPPGNPAAFGGRYGTPRAHGTPPPP